MNCADCKGTGADLKRTAELRAAGKIDAQAYIRCWTCNGNGLAPVYPGDAWRGPILKRPVPE